MRSTDELAKTNDPEGNSIRGRIRRMAITATAKALWTLAGYLIDGQREEVPAEAFTGIGIAARPPATGKPEAIVLMLHDAKHPVIAAVRDQKTAAAIAGAIKAGETMLFNALALVYLKDDGTIEARSAGGVAVPLATLADVQAIRNALHEHAHTYAGGAGPALTTLNPAVPAPTGTTKLRGE
jgi:hypothetical protein